MATKITMADELRFMKYKLADLAKSYRGKHDDRTIWCKIKDKLFYNWNGRSKYGDFNNIVLDIIEEIDEILDE